MRFDVRQPLAKAVVTTRSGLRAWLPKPAGDRNATCAERSAGLTTADIARLLRDVPLTAVNEAHLDLSKQVRGRIFFEKFHSLGTTCEFGFFQRLFGAEPLDLFRFGAISVGGLIAGIESGLGALTEPQNISMEFDREIVEDRPQTAIIVRPHSFRLHGGNLPPFTSFEDVKSLQIKRLDLLRRKFFEDLRDAERIFVCLSDADTEPEVCKLARLMRTFGPTNLLWVTLEEPGNPTGTVELIAEGLMRGYLDRLGLRGATWQPSGAWFKLCCEAYRMHSARKAAAMP